MPEVTIYIDGKAINAPVGISVRKAALRAGVYIPGLCSHPDLNPFKPFQWSESVWQGMTDIKHEHDADFPHCDLCMVAAGEDAPQRACTLEVADGLQIRTRGDDLDAARKNALKKILAHHPHACLTCAQQEGCSVTQCSMNVPVEDRCCELLGSCEIGKVANYIGIPPDTPSYSRRSLPEINDEPLFVRNYELCINCLRCVRVCRDVREVDVLGAVNSSLGVRVGTVGGPTLIEALCRFCGACVEVCPTGALRDQPGFSPLVDDNAPCVAACPLEIDIPGYIDLIAQDRNVEALELIRRDAILPGVLGYACFHPCEDSCRRGSLDEPVAICALKRYISDSAGDTSLKSDKAPPSGKKVAVIGGGPAGLAAAAELLKRGHGATIFEKDERLGGMLCQSLPGFRLPEAVLERDLAHLAELGLNAEFDTAFGTDFDAQKLKADGFDAVIIAIGLPSALKLNVQGEDMPGVEMGLDFLRRARRREIEAITSPVVVIGGGSVAVDSAMTALRLGAGKVTMVCLESTEEMPAHAEELQAAVEEGINVHNRWGVAEIKGDNNRANEVVLKRCTRVFDSQHRFSPQYDPEITTTLPFGQLIVAIGQRVPDELKKQLNLQVQDAYIVGDCSTGPSSIVAAMADGRRAARAIDKQFGGPGVVTVGVMEVRKNLERDPMFHTRLRTVPERVDPEVRKRSFELYDCTFTSDDAGNESARCLKCHLRATLTAPPLPPDQWCRISLDIRGEIPACEGVLIFADDAKQVVKILGSANLQAAFDDLLDEDNNVAFVRWEPDPMFTKRESELLQAHLREHGELPGADDLDDLF